MWMKLSGRGLLLKLIQTMEEALPRGGEVIDCYERDTQIMRMLRKGGVMVMSDRHKSIFFTFPFKWAQSPLPLSFSFTLFQQSYQA